MSTLITYNAQHGLCDVTAPDGALLGSVPDTRLGRLAGGDAIVAYLVAAEDRDDTLVTRLRVARGVIVSAGGTPNMAEVRQGLGSWAAAVRRHQTHLARRPMEFERAA